MSAHPRLRAWDTCPCCTSSKARGLIACWECFNRCEPWLLDEIADIAEGFLLNAHRKAEVERFARWQEKERALEAQPWTS